MGTSPDADLVNSMLDQATKTLKDEEHPILHSDRGTQYRWPGWISRISEAGVIPSMSRKGCPPDNAACEGFFGRMKNEMYYGHEKEFSSFIEFSKAVSEYIDYYNNRRIQKKTKWMPPVKYRMTSICSA